MIAGFYTVIVGLIGIFVVRSMLIKRDNGISIKGGVVMFLATLLITFGNSFIEGGTERINEMFQLNMITSSFCGIIVGGLFFWKKRDLYDFLDKNKILFNWKVTPSGSIENFEKWQKEQELTKKEMEALSDSHSSSEFVQKEEVLKRLRKDLDHIKAQGADPTPQLRFETGKKSFIKEERQYEIEKDMAKKRQRQMEQEDEDYRRREREREEERQRQQRLAMQQNTYHYTSYEDSNCGSGSSGNSSSSSSSSSSYDSGSSSSSSDSGSSSCD